MLRVDALLHRPRIDVRARLKCGRRLLAHPREQGVETGADHIVIVVAPRVARDLCASAVGALCRVRSVGVVQSAGDDDRLRGRDNVADVAAAIGAALKVRHLARVSAVEPLAVEGQLGMRGCRRDAAEIESEIARLLFDRGRGERVGHNTPSAVSSRLAAVNSEPLGPSPSARGLSPQPSSAPPQCLPTSWRNT